MIASLSTQPTLPAVNPHTDGAQTPPQSETAFSDFVGNVFFSQMMKALRSTQQEVAYLGGGQAEKTFQSQMDQQLVNDLATRHGGDFAAPMQSRFATSIDVKV